MHISLIPALVLLVSASFSAAKPAKRSYNTHDYYVLEHDPKVVGAPLETIAGILGVDVIEQVGELKNHWLVRSEKVEGRSSVIEERSEEEVRSDPVIARYNDLRVRSNQDLHSRSKDAVLLRRYASSIKSLEYQKLRRRVKRAPPPIPPPSADSALGVAQRLGIKDPRFTDQWHHVNEEFPENTMNVTGLWESGYTGKGVISSLIDDGLDYTSDDLAENFDADDSYDYNDHEDLPTPKLSDDTHGTRCAGQIAAVKNDVCGVGIAYESKIAAVRILSGYISDADEAAALNYGYQNVSIYSCSWGPPDDGKTMEGPDHIIRKAMLEGINNGRGGKGSVFVFASGNGAGSGDQCNFDGYTNSIYSVTVSAVDYKDMHPYYSEPCAANMIVTTDKGKNKCTSSHGGTSAAAPNAAGVFALALQARPDLTWRDIQHLCVNTGRQINPDDDSWDLTAAGRPFSYKFGYGALDGYKLVNAALSWENVKPQTWFKTHTTRLNDGTMTADKNFSGGVAITEEGVTSGIEVTKEMLDRGNFDERGLEHVNIKVWIQHERRGDVAVEIVSPNGFKSVLAEARKFDKADTGFPGWTFMSVKHWGENPIGTWTIRVSDSINPEDTGHFLGWNIMFWGSAMDPDTSKIRKFELPPDDTIFPPHEDPPAPLPSATTSRIYTKPTNFLSSTDPVHGTTAAEAIEQTASSVSSPYSSPPGLSKLISDQKVFFGLLFLVAFVGVGIALCLWRRRVKIRKANYEVLAGGPGNDMAMSDINLPGARGRGGRSNRTGREMYDAFEEGSDEDEADEATDEQPMLRRDQRGPVSAGLPRSAGGGQYRDEPEPEPEPERPTSRLKDRDSGEDGDSSGDGSWEHASR